MKIELCNTDYSRKLFISKELEELSKVIDNDNIKCFVSKIPSGYYIDDPSYNLNIKQISGCHGLIGVTGPTGATGCWGFGEPVKIDQISYLDEEQLVTFKFISNPEQMDKYKSLATFIEIIPKGNNYHRKIEVIKEENGSIQRVEERIENTYSKGPSSELYSLFANYYPERIFCMKDVVELICELDCFDNFFEVDNDILRTQNIFMSEVRKVYTNEPVRFTFIRIRSSELRNNIHILTHLLKMIV